jgi:hypothetical protein
MKITGSAIGRLAIDLLEKMGYHCFYGPNIAPDETNKSLF